MNQYILFMHPSGDGVGRHAPPEAWAEYFATLRSLGAFEGGSAIGRGACFTKEGTPPPTTRISGYIRVRAESLEAAQELLAGNPVYEAGGTVEIRELPRTG